MEVEEVVALKQRLIKYDEIDAAIKELNEKLKPLRMQLKNLRLEKKSIQENICESMGTVGVDVCNLPVIEGKKPYALQHSVTTVPLPMSSAHVKELLFAYFSDEEFSNKQFYSMPSVEKAMSIYNFMYNKENQHTKEKESLRKVKYIGEKKQADVQSVSTRND
jgi:hypothetical protein